MRKAILALCALVLLASFANDTSNKTILKDIDGTLLESFVVLDHDANTVTFTVDSNTSVSSAVIDGEFKIFLIENGNSGKNVSITLKASDGQTVSFDHFFEASYDVASTEDMLSKPIKPIKRPRGIII